MVSAAAADGTPLLLKPILLKDQGPAEILLYLVCALLCIFCKAISARLNANQCVVCLGKSCGNAQQRNRPLLVQLEFASAFEANFPGGITDGQQQIFLLNLEKLALALGTLIRADMRPFPLQDLEVQFTGRNSIMIG